MLTKLCSRCGRVIDYTQRYCNECSKRVIEQQREKYKDYKRNRKDKDIQKIYVGKHWKAVRKIALNKANYLCEECLKNNKITFADEVHHKAPIKDGGEVYSLENLICVCHSCHMKLHEELNKNK